MFSYKPSVERGSYAEDFRSSSPPANGQLPFARGAGAKATVDMDELQHRMKNMLSVIQALSRQTMIHCATKEQFDQRFAARLSSYCQSIDRLIANNWRGLGIHELIHTQLAAVADGTENSFDGPELNMSTHAAHWIGLAIHELATNALKYGALSVPRGRVHIAWTVVPAAGGDRFQLQWREADGPPVTPPERRGFGGRLVQELIASAVSGKVAHDFQTAGVIWTLDAPTAVMLDRRGDD